MAELERSAYMPLFIDDIHKLYINVDGEIKNLGELLEQIDPVEIDLPVVTTEIVSSRDLNESSERFFRISSSSRKICCYNVGGGRVYLPCP